MVNGNVSDNTTSGGDVHLNIFFIVRVAVAVKYFKEGDLDKALGLLHHALDIDPRNVEGLVARGAL